MANNNGQTEAPARPSYDFIMSWRAMNGHEMAYYADADGNLKPGYSAFAWCVDDCGACQEGEPLPDW